MTTEPAAPAAEAWQACLDACAAADEAASTGRETGTPEGDRAHELAHEADLAYERFAEAWHDAEGHSQ